MITLDSIKEILTKEKKHLSRKYHIKSLAIISSAELSEIADGETVEILVDFKNQIGIEYLDLVEDLERILEHKVDLVSRTGMKSQYYTSIKRDLCYVFR